MSHYRKVETRVWADRKFAGLSDDAKLTFFRLLTHPNLTSLGSMRASLAGLGEEANWKPDRFRKAFAELVASGIVQHDAAALLICFPNFIRYNQPESPNVVRSWGKAYDALPECPLKSLVGAWAVASLEDKSEGFHKAIPEALRKTSGKPPPKPKPYQEQEQEHKQEESSQGEGNSQGVDGSTGEVVDFGRRRAP